MNPNNTMMQLSEIAARIKEMRTIMGWSISELAEKVEFTEERCTVYESGMIDIPFSFIHKCALAFDVEMSELLEGRAARLTSYTVTRKGGGQKTAQEKEKRRQSLESNSVYSAGACPACGQLRRYGLCDQQQMGNQDRQHDRIF